MPKQHPEAYILQFVELFKPPLQLVGLCPLIRVYVSRPSTVCRPVGYRCATWRPVTQASWRRAQLLLNARSSGLNRSNGLTVLFTGYPVNATCMSQSAITRRKRAVTELGLLNRL